MVKRAIYMTLLIVLAFAFLLGISAEIPPTICIAHEPAKS